MTLSRRGFFTGVGAAAALSLAPKGFASAELDWRAAYSNAPVDGYGPSALKLVHGKMPTGLKGVFYRNGPAWFQHGDSYLDHWFDGDGMVHAITIEDGEANHRSKFVQTRKHREEVAEGRFLATGFGSEGDPNWSIMSPDDVNAANTSVLKVGDDLLALWEAGSPFAVDPMTLETRGAKSLRPDLAGMPFLAHPKVAPDGRIWNLAVAGRRVGIYRMSANGALEDFSLVEIEIPAYIHDFAMTEKSIVILVQPWAQTRNIPPFVDGFKWMPERGMRVMIIDKDDYSNVRWGQLPARSFFHTGDAWEDTNGTVYFDVCTYTDPSFGAEGEAGVIRGDYRPGKAVTAQLSLAKIPVKGEAELLETGLGSEFPQTDKRVQGKEHRYVWAVGTETRAHAPGSSKLHLQDWNTGKRQTHDFGHHAMVEEHLFVPRPGSVNEGDGWMIGTVFNMKAQATEFHVFDALKIADGPIATMRAPYAWPLGFHGTWAGA